MVDRFHVIHLSVVAGQSLSVEVVDRFHYLYFAFVAGKGLSVEVAVRFHSPPPLDYVVASWSMFLRL